MAIIVHIDPTLLPLPTPQRSMPPIPIPPITHFPPRPQPQTAQSASHQTKLHHNIHYTMPSTTPDPLTQLPPTSMRPVPPETTRLLRSLYNHLNMTKTNVCAKWSQQIYHDPVVSCRSKTSGHCSKRWCTTLQVEPSSPRQRMVLHTRSGQRSSSWRDLAASTQ